MDYIFFLTYNENATMKRKKGTVSESISYLPRIIIILVFISGLVDGCESRVDGLLGGLGRVGGGRLSLGAGAAAGTPVSLSLTAAEHGRHAAAQPPSELALHVLQHLQLAVLPLGSLGLALRRTETNTTPPL